MKQSTYKVKVGLAEMLKGGVIMDVTNADQAKIAEQAGVGMVILYHQLHLAGDTADEMLDELVRVKR